MHIYTHIQTCFLQDTEEVGQGTNLDRRHWAGVGGTISARLYKKSDFPKGNRKDFRRHSGLRPGRGVRGRAFLVLFRHMNRGAKLPSVET